MNQTAMSFATTRSLIHVVLYKAIPVLTAVTIAACTHIHNPGNAELATSTLQTFKEATAGDHNIFITMLKNREAATRSADVLHAELAKVRVETEAVALPLKSWGEIKQAVDAGVSRYKNQKEKLDNKYIELCKQLEKGTGEVEGATEAKKRVISALEQAIDQENLWYARQTLFLKALKLRFPADEADDGSDLESKTKKRKNSIEEILKQEIEVSVYNKDQGKIQTEKRKLGTILESDLNRAKERKVAELLKAYTRNMFSADSAPGLNALILSVSADQADVELRRAQVEVWRIKQHMNHIERFGRFVDQKIDVLSLTQRALQADFTTQQPEKYTLQADQKVRQTFTKARSKTDDDEVGLITAYQVLMQYLVNLKLDEARYERFSVEPDRIDHEYSIRLSALNAEEREILIQSGLTGLKLFHDGGLRPEQVANILRGLQALALAFIGSQLD